MSLTQEFATEGRHAAPLTRDLAIADAASFLAEYAVGSENDLAQGFELSRRQVVVRYTYDNSVNNQAYLQAFYPEQEAK